MKDNKTPEELGFVDWNSMSMNDYVKHLETKFIFKSTGTAKAVMELIDFYRENKSNTTKIQDRELLLTFLRDLKYCSGDDNGDVNLSEDSEFYVNAFIESNDYEVFKNKMKR